MSWTGENWGPRELRFVADLTGDGRADIVGFGRDGVWAAVNRGGHTFSLLRMSLTSFNSQGWRVDQHVRLLADLTGDGKADIIGFGDNDVGIALSNGDGTFAQDRSVLTEFITSKGWRVDQHPRFVVDITGDGKADIVGFGNDGVWTALGNGDGTFQTPKLVLEGFNVNQGWRVDQHIRLLADLTGDGKADIIGFGNDGVWTALGNGDGTFQAPKLVLTGFNINQGWRVDQHPRFVVDLTGDGKADIIGFGDDGVWTALSNGDGTFQTPKLVLEGFSNNQGWRVEQHPRFVVDLTGDGKADLVGFGNDGVWTALSNGDGTFGEPKFFEEFGVKQGWRVEQHVRLLVDLSGDGKADIIGFGNDAGPRIALGNGDGTFQPSQLVREVDIDHTGPVVQSITIDFHTLNDDLDHNTELHVFVKNRRSDSSDPDADWYSKNPYLGYAMNASQGKTLDDNSTHRVQVQLRSQPIPFEELLLPAVHLHILTVGDDRWKFDYTLTITLNDGTVLPPFHSNINGLTGIILDQDNRNYYGICSDVRPTPPRAAPATDAKLTGVIIEFHTHNDDKKDDTKLGIHIVNRVSATVSRDIVVANGVAAGQSFPDSDKSETSIDERYARIDLPLASNAILLRDMVLPVVFINIAAGQDRWIFDYRVTLVFGQDQPYSWTVSGIILDEQYHKHMGIYNGRPFPTLYAPKAMLSPSSIQRRKSISLAFLQQKLDELLNRRQVKDSLNPLLILKLDSPPKPWGRVMPASFLDVQFITNDPPPPDGASLAPDYQMGTTYTHSRLELHQLRNVWRGLIGLKFNDIRSQSLSLNVNFGDNITPLTIDLQFETDGPLEVTGTDEMNVINFEVTLRFTLRFDSKTGAVDLLGWVEDLNPEIFTPVPNTKPQRYKIRGTFLGQTLEDFTFDPHEYQIDRVGQMAHVVFTTEDKPDLGGTIQKKLRGAIFDQLSERNTITKITPRESINAQFSSWLMGGVITSGNPELVPYPNPCQLSDANVSNDTLTLNYVGSKVGYQTPADWTTRLEPSALANIDHIVVLT